MVPLFGFNSILVVGKTVVWSLGMQSWQLGLMLLLCEWGMAKQTASPQVAKVMGDFWVWERRRNVDFSLGAIKWQMSQLQQRKRFKYDMGVYQDAPSPETVFRVLSRRWLRVGSKDKKPDLVSETLSGLSFKTFNREEEF
jgi:hypothetical protein